MTSIRRKRTRHVRVLHRCHRLHHQIPNTQSRRDNPHNIPARDGDRLHRPRLRLHRPTDYRTERQNHRGEHSAHGRKAIRTCSLPDGHGCNSVRRHTLRCGQYTEWAERENLTFGEIDDLNKHAIHFHNDSPSGLRCFPSPDGFIITHDVCYVKLRIGYQQGSWHELSVVYRLPCIGTRRSLLRNVCSLPLLTNIV